MRLVLITGMSGSGKSAVALRLLEDIGYYCVDNLPPRFLAQLAAYLADAGQEEVAVSVDARSELSLGQLPQIIGHLRNAGHDLRVLFLTASTEALMHRYSETRRRHPLSGRLALAEHGPEPTLGESIEAERELLAPLDKAGYVIDTSELAPATLREWVRQFAGSAPATLNPWAEEITSFQWLPRRIPRRRIGFLRPPFRWNDEIPAGVTLPENDQIVI